VSSTGSALHAADAAQEAYDLSTADPQRAWDLARQALDLARAAADPAAESVAEQALGIAARTLGRIPTAIKHLERGVKIADSAGLARQAGRCRVSLAPTLQIAGQGPKAVATLERALVALRGVDRAQALVQLGGMLHLVGDRDRAFDCFRRAMPVLRAHGDIIWEARGVAMRAELYVDRGHFVAGDADYRRGEELFLSLGHPYYAAGMRHNRGWVAAYAGDIPRALDHFDTAEQRFRELRIPMGLLWLDRAHLLLVAGLADEARSLAERTAADLLARGEHGPYADAALVASHAALAAGDPDAAAGWAKQARERFRRQRRTGWQALAGYAAVRAAWGAGDRSARALRAACRTGDELAAAGLMGAALDARLVAGRTALALGRRDAARAQLAEVSRARTRGTAEQRSRGWLAEALVRLDDGRRGAAIRALRAGVDVIDAHRATLGATELRAHASGHAEDLATLGQRVALDSGRPDAVLEWTERFRAAALRLPPVRPPDDREVAEELAELRKVHADLEAAGAESRPTAALARRQAALEESVRRRTRRSSGTAQDREPVATAEQLAARLHEAALVEIAEIDGTLYAVTLVGHRLRLHQLSSAQSARAEVDACRFALRRLAYRRGSAASTAAAQAAVAHAGDQLDDLLVRPLLGEVGDRPLVVVPPASLHAVPWSTMPSCRDRPVTVAPSATTWLRAAASRPPRHRQVLLAAGPGLPGATAEVQALSRMHAGAIALAGPDATAAAVSAGLDGASLGHLAAHGVFRADNPLFSSLMLADGPLTVYDLERLNRAPHLLVLSSCDSGLAGVRAGDELMGLAAAMFPLGTAGIAASVVPVPDGATLQLMSGLHERLVAGASLPVALTGARSTLDADDPAAMAAGAAFVALGAG
jgi:CHAT domain-containing protein